VYFEHYRGTEKNTDSGFKQIMALIGEMDISLDGKQLGDANLTR
jgi:hypothetical protein